MAAEQDRPAKGTILYLLDTTWKPVALRLSLTGPGAKHPTREVKHLDSTHMQRKGTIPDAGPCSGSLYYDPNGDVHKLLTGICRSGAVRQWIVRFNTEDVDPLDNASVKFPGILAEIMPGANEVDGALEAPFTIDVAGLPTEGTFETLSALP